MLLAWAGIGELSRPDGIGFGTQSLQLAALLGFLLCAPIAAYFLAYHPDWMLAYLVDVSRLPGIVTSALVLACAAAPPAGVLVAAKLASRQRTARLLELAVLTSAVALLTLLPGAQRLGVQATYAQFHGDFGVLPIAGSRLGLALVWMLTLLAVGVIWTAVTLRRLTPPHRPR